MEIFLNVYIDYYLSDVNPKDEKSEAWKNILY